MWEVYNLNKEATKSDISTTLKILYPKNLPPKFSLNDAIQMYSYGLSYNQFSDFRKFVMGLTNASK